MRQTRFKANQLMLIMWALSDLLTKGKTMRLLHNNGAPIGINFRRHQTHSGYVIRVTGGAQQTDFGVTPDNIAECYEKAIDKRLELLGIPDDAEAWQTLASAYGAFLTYYGITVKTVSHLEFEIKGK